MSNYTEQATESAQPVEVYSDSSCIAKAKAKIQDARLSNIRQTRMDNNEENKTIIKRMHDLIAPVGSPRRIKDTSMMQVLRLVSEDLYRRPQIMAQQEAGENEIIPKTVDSIVERIKGLGNYDQCIRNALSDATGREGSSFVMVVPMELQDKSGENKDKRLDILDYRNADSTSVFIDKDARYIEDAEWVAIRYEFQNEEALQQLEAVYGYTGDIEPGDCLYAVDRQESGENDEDVIHDTTAIYEYWNRIDGERVVFAGLTSKEVQFLDGEDYPYFNEYGQPDIPIAQLDATAFKYHLYAMSYVDVAKDITEQQKRQFNQVLPYFDRVSNPLLAITGVTPLEDIVGQIQEAEEFQEQGLLPFLTLSDPQAKVASVFPSDVTAPLERIKSIFADELSNRLGLDLRVQQQSSAGGTPTATQVLERAKTHNKAIANINNINVPFYRRLAKITFNYAQSLWDDGDTRNISIKKGAKDEYILPISDALKATKGWKGNFEVDTTVEVELTRNEQVIVIQEIKRNFIADLQIPATSEAEVKPLADTMKAHIALVGMEKYFQDSEVDEFYSAIIARGKAQIEREMMMQQQAQQKAQGGGQQSGSGIEDRQGATRGTPEGQQPSANQGANAPQPQEL